MPCRSDYDSGAELSELRAELERVTRVACEACRLLELHHIELDTHESDIWWTDHKRKDEARAARDAQEIQAKKDKAMLRANAASKLTPQEREELGL